MREADLYARAIRVGECLIWQGAIKSNGYGNLIIDGRTWLAHRLSYTLSVGPIPAGRSVLHSCDVRACIEPSHLRVGTSAENSQEMVERKRYRGPARLSPEERWQVAADHAAGESQASISRRVGVSSTTVHNIVHGRYMAFADARWNDPKQESA